MISFTSTPREYRAARSRSLPIGLILGVLTAAVLALLLLEIDSMRKGLVTANAQLRTTNAQLRTTNEQLRFTNDRLMQTNRKLSSVSRALGSMRGDLRSMRGDLSKTAQKITHAKLLF